MKNKQPEHMNPAKSVCVALFSICQLKVRLSTNSKPFASYEMRRRHTTRPPQMWSCIQWMCTVWNEQSQWRRDRRSAELTAFNCLTACPSATKQKVHCLRSQRQVSKVVGRTLHICSQNESTLSGPESALGSIICTQVTLNVKCSTWNLCLKRKSKENK